MTGLKTTVDSSFTGTESYNSFLLYHSIVMNKAWTVLCLKVKVRKSWEIPKLHSESSYWKSKGE